jgi:hypothetical protein
LACFFFLFFTWAAWRASDVTFSGGQRVDQAVIIKAQQLRPTLFSATSLDFLFDFSFLQKLF